MTTCTSTTARDRAALVRFAREILDATPHIATDNEHGRATHILRGRLADAANRGNVEAFEVLRAALRTFARWDRPTFRSILVRSGASYRDAKALIELVRTGGEPP